MSELVKQAKALQADWYKQRKRANRAERRLHAVLEHHGLDDVYERLDTAEAAVKRLEAVIDALELPERSET